MFTGRMDSYFDGAKVTGKGSVSHNDRTRKIKSNIKIQETKVKI